MTTFPFPVVVTAAGLQPIPPATLLARLISAVSTINPGYTALPGTLIEDISSTDVGSMVVMNQAMIDLVNSLTPFGANVPLLIQWGNVYGVPLGRGSNASVYCVFSGSAGFVIPVGFVIADTGGNQYTVQNGTVVGQTGQTGQVYCLATQSGIFAIPPGTVTVVVTNLPSGVMLTVTNPAAGTPGTTTVDYYAYRNQVLQAGMAVGQTLPAYLRTQLLNISGVQPQQTAIAQVGSTWQVICGGGDPYFVAYAIATSIQDFFNIVGSQLGITGITAANPGVVTTNIPHNFSVGQQVTISGASPSGYNSTWTIPPSGVLSLTTFQIGDTSALSAYVSGAIFDPNPRNQTIDLVDYPDTYALTFVVPPQQAVTIDLTWNTTSPNAVSDQVISSLGSAAFVSYVNTIPVGSPINLFELQSVFQEAIVGVLPTPLLTRMVFVVTINGFTVAATSGTGIIASDPEGYFSISPTSITITQG